MLVDVLKRQQPHSRYPFTWPPPFPAEAMVVRDTELAAWTAELDGRPVGHASLTVVDSDELGRVWSAGAGRPQDQLACVSSLFVDIDLQGEGVGGRLLDAAVEHARALDRAPVLDVVQGPSAAVSVYRHRGWVEVGRARPDWLPDDEPPVLMMALPDEAAERPA